MAVKFTQPAITKVITGTLAAAPRESIEFDCWCEPGNRHDFQRTRWGGEFSTHAPIQITREPLSLTTKSGDQVNILLAVVRREARAGERMVGFYTFEGFGKTPKELYVEPDLPKRKPAKVRVIMARNHVNGEPEEFDTIGEALEQVKYCVDQNTAAPVWMEVPSSLIGSGPALFDTEQIYAMLDLIED